MYIKLLAKLTLLLTIELISTKAYTMQIIEPEYYVKLDMHSCPRTVIVNGVIIEDNPDGYSSASELPINHWIRNGENTLELFLLSDQDMEEEVNETSKCNISVWVKGIKGDEVINHKIADIIYKPNLKIDQNERYKSSIESGSYKVNGENPTPVDSNSDITIGEIKTGDDYYEDGGITITRSFTASVSFPEWAFFSAETIPFYPYSEEKYKKLKENMWPMMVELWDMFENKEIDKILPLFESRSKELDIAYYRSPGYSIKSFETDLRNIYKSGYPLNRKESDHMQLLVNYNEKLITIVNAANATGSIMFYDKESDSNMFFDVVWMKKNNQWIIAR